jgi:hypothetical protein
MLPLSSEQACQNARPILPSLFPANIAGVRLLLPFSLAQHIISILQASRGDIGHVADLRLATWPIFLRSIADRFSTELLPPAYLVWTPCEHERSRRKPGP